MPLIMDFNLASSTERYARLADAFGVAPNGAGAKAAANTSAPSNPRRAGVEEFRAMFEAGLA